MNGAPERITLTINNMATSSSAVGERAPRSELGKHNTKQAVSSSAAAAVNKLKTLDTFQKIKIKAGYF